LRYRRFFNVHGAPLNAKNAALKLVSHIWHNDAWIDVWKTWINHQNAISQYLKSKEFKQLLQEFKQNEHNK